MNVLIFTSEFPPEPGGIGNHAYGLFVSLIKLGHNVRVFTNSRNSKSENQCLKESPFKHLVRYIPRNRPIFITYFHRLYGFAKEIRNMKQNKDNVILFSGKFSVWLLGLISMPADMKMLIVIHGSEIKQGGFGSFLFRRAFAKADAVIAVSSFTRERILASYNLASCKIDIIHNGFLVPPIEFQNRLQEDCSLITLGNVSYRKGQFNVVHALPEILKYLPNCSYQVLGIPSQADDLRSELKKMNLQNRVHIHGKVTEEEKWHYLSNSHVFMMLSEELPNGDFEGFGIAILEGNAMGLPAIGSRNSGIADAIKDGYSGFLVDPHNPVEIAEALCKIMAEFPKFCAQAKEHASRFHWDFKVQEYVELIRQLK